MLFDILFPSKCVGCGTLGTSICAKCIQNIHPITTNVCPACFFPSWFGTTHEQCHKQTYLDGAISLVQYSGVVKQIVKITKYRGAHKTLSDFLSRAPLKWYETMNIFSKKIPRAILCPIPLHKIRENNRGFNQSIILAKTFEKTTTLPVKPLLKRVKNTPPQAQQKTRKARKENIKSAFEIRNIYKPISEVVLVDDLFTSGNTANEAARMLKKNGAEKVYLFTLAHG